MTDYLIRTGKDGMVTDLLELDEENESYLSDECDDCKQLEAAMLAIVHGLREKIAMLESRITYLEKQPVQVVPMQPYYVPSSAPSTADPLPWWETNRFTCKI